MTNLRNDELDTQHEGASRSAKGNNPLITFLQNGDVIVEAEDAPKSQKNSSKSYQEKVEKDFTNLLSKADHGMVYGEEINQGQRSKKREDNLSTEDRYQRVYHSSRGEIHSGVRSHPLKYVADQDKNESGHVLGSFRVLRCKDEVLADYFFKAAQRWDASLLSINTNNVSKFPIKLPTPFIDAEDRQQDPESKQIKFELFRAFRAYMRNHARPTALPLSNKGVSCSNFLGFAFKTAIIDRLFPNGIPKEIQDKLRQAEFYRQNNPNISSITKLDQNYPDFFDEFLNMVEQHINHAPSITGDMKKSYFEYLANPVKGYTIEDFCDYALRFPEIWNYEGILFYQQIVDEQGQNQIIPSVMNLDAYDMLTENKEKPMMLHHDDLEDALNIDINISREAPTFKKT